MSSAVRGDPAICDAHGRDRHPDRRGRRRARAVLEGAQGGVPRDGPDRAALLRAGRRHPAHEAPEVLSGSRARRGVRHARGQRLPRRRRQPAPARLLRRRRGGEAERAEELAGRDPRGCVDAGGSITGEHGVGVDKKRYMPKMFGEPDLAAFQKLRCAFDPDGLANPGKVMPTPRLCGEVPGPYRQHPLEATGWRSGSDGQSRDTRPGPQARRACCARGEGPVRIAGGGTKLGWGNPAPSRRRALDAPASTRSSSTTRRPHRHRSRPACRSRGAGAVRRRRADARARPARGAGATIGGLVATGDSGPLRHRYGGPRDLVLGVTVALSDGTVATRGRQGHQERRGLRPVEADVAAPSGRSG